MLILTETNKASYKNTWNKFVPIVFRLEKFISRMCTVIHKLFEEKLLERKALPLSVSPPNFSSDRAGNTNDSRITCWTWKLDGAEFLANANPAASGDIGENLFNICSKDERRKDESRVMNRIFPTRVPRSSIPPLRIDGIPSRVDFKRISNSKEMARYSILPTVLFYFILFYFSLHEQLANNCSSEIREKNRIYVERTHVILLGSSLSRPGRENISTI